MYDILIFLLPIAKEGKNIQLSCQLIIAIIKWPQINEWLIHLSSISLIDKYPNYRYHFYFSSLMLDTTFIFKGEMRGTINF